MGAISHDSWRRMRHHDELQVGCRSRDFHHVRLPSAPSLSPPRLAHLFTVRCPSAPVLSTLSAFGAHHHRPRLVAPSRHWPFPRCRLAAVRVCACPISRMPSRGIVISRLRCPLCYRYIHGMASSPFGATLPSPPSTHLLRCTNSSAAPNPRCRPSPLPPLPPLFLAACPSPFSPRLAPPPPHGTCHDARCTPPPHPTPPSKPLLHRTPILRIVVSTTLISSADQPFSFTFRSFHLHILYLCCARRIVTMRWLLSPTPCRSPSSKV